MKRKTISQEVAIEGIGLHTGKQIKMKLCPAEVNTGIRFVRTDLEEEVIIAADIGYVSSTNRSTNLEKGETKICTTEHLLAALAGNGIDDVLVKLDGPEVPIMDGSALPFVEMIKKAQPFELDEEKEVFEIHEIIHFIDEESGAEYYALPAEEFNISVMVDYPSTILSGQYAELNDISDFNENVASCRTFVFTNELLKLASDNLIKGGDLENAIVIAQKDTTQEELDEIAKKLGKNSVALANNRQLNDKEWQFVNEPARHKLLDVLGDLALLGRPIKGKIIANKPGHTGNIKFTKVLKKKYQDLKRLKGKPKYDPNAEPLMNVEQIKELLPHRYPFLLVDKIIEKSSTCVVGVKSITVNESLFQGHFPGNPLFPGVLQMEALAQTGGILALSGVEDPKDWDTLFLKMDKVKFKNKVVPGDTLILKMELLSPIRRGLVQMQGTAYVGNRIVSEGELVAQIIKRS